MEDSVTINNLFLRSKNPMPIPIPSNPVVKGKINNSLGIMITNNKVVRTYAIHPNDTEIIVLISMGTMAKGLKAYPAPGKKPPIL